MELTPEQSNILKAALGIALITDPVETMAMMGNIKSKQKAFRESLGGKPAPTYIEDLTEEQRPVYDEMVQSISDMMSHLKKVLRPQMVSQGPQSNN